MNEMLHTAHAYVGLSIHSLTQQLFFLPESMDQHDCCSLLSIHVALCKRPREFLATNSQPPSTIECRSRALRVT